MDFTLHTAATAPDQAKAQLEDSEAKYKFVPNLHAIMAESPALLDAGYSRRTMQDVILAVAFKVMSNYMNHIAETDVDAPFQSMLWTKPGADAA